MNEEIKFETEIEHTEVALSESVDDLEKNIKSTDDIPLESACIYGLSIRNKRSLHR